MAPLRSTFDRVEPRDESPAASSAPLDVFTAQCDLVRDAVIAVTRTPAGSRKA